jgi:hypothetical protein
MSKFIKLQVEKIEIDARYQRELDQGRATAMSKHIDLDRIGVPVVSRRADGKCVVLDGQHRVKALQMAGKGALQILCEVHEGLSLLEEATLFLKLNGGRKAIRVYDKWRAQLVSRVPTALEIEKILSTAGLRISKASGNNCVCAISAIWGVHVKYKNLSDTLAVLKSWGEGDPGVYEAELIKATSEFLRTYPSADPKQLIKKLETYSPERIQMRIARTTSKADRIPFRDAAVIVLREIYNFRSKVKLLPLHRVREDEAA